MLQKIGNYYLGIIKKYGWILPVALVALAYGAMIAVDATNALSLLANASIAWFIVLACLAGVAFIAGVVYTVLKLNAKELGIQDLGMACLAVIGVLMMIMFIFTSAGGWMNIVKWVGTAVAVVVCLGFSAYRALKVVD